MMDGPAPETTEQEPVAPDANWGAFVQKNAAPQPEADPKWDNLVQSYASPVAPQPKTLSEFGQKLIQPVAEFALDHMVPKPAPPPTEYDKTIDKDTQAFRNSDSFINGSRNFANLVSDAVIKPAAEAYTHQVQAANDTWMQALSTEAPKDEYGNQQPESIEQAIDRTMKLMTAPFMSAAAAIGLTPAIQVAATDPTARLLFPGDAQRQKAFSEGLAQQIALLPMQAEGAIRGAPDAPSVQLRNAVRAQVFDEKAYFTEPPKSPVPEIPEEAAKPEAPPAPDIHAIARTVAPETFDKYDRLSAQKDTLRTQLSEASDNRTADLDAKIKEIQDAKQGGYGKLQSLIAKRDKIAEEGDTPEMAEIRKKLQETDYQMRDLAPAVTDAYSKAREQVPEPEAPEAAAEAEKPADTQPEAPQKPIEEQKASIASDVSQKLQAAGRPVEEADAAAQLEAARYATLAAQYPKFSAEEWYRREGANIKGPRRTEPALTQSTKLGEGELGQPDAAPPFYSSLTRTVEEAPQEKASAEQWAATLRNAKGLKKEELDWSGVHEWLDEQKGTVTKEQVLDHLRSNEVQLKEVVKGDGNEEDFARIAGRMANIDDEIYKLEREADSPAAVETRTVRSYTTDGDRERIAKVNELRDEQAGLETQLHDAKSGDTKFSKYTLPGGQRYREMLLTLPHDLNHDSVSQKMFGKNYSELSGSDKAAVENQRHSFFKSGHFDEPNILAHIRFDDRTGPNGEKILHVAEIQSDAHQKGRKVGYGTPKVEENTGEHSESRPWKVGDTLFADKGNAENFARDQGRDRVPDMPFKATEAWASLGLKRMLRYAAENGYDKLTWDTGETQAERYDLSKQISKITYNNPGSKTAAKYGTVLKAFDHEGHEVINKSATPEELSDIIGKDTAEKLLDTEPNGDKHELTGVDLKVGGEGMKGFYDKILPTIANKLGKKFGAKAEDAKVSISKTFRDVASFHVMDDKVGGYNFAVANADDVPMNRFVTREDAEKWLSQQKSGVASAHSLDITPEMRESVMQGQPLFQANRGKIRLANGDSKALISLMKNANGSTWLHESGHHFTDQLFRLAKEADAPQQMKDDAATLKKWLGLSENDDIRAVERRGKDVKYVYEKELEKLADGFVRYVMEGTAPSRQLAAVFAKFKQWLVAIYKTVDALKSPISDDVRDVYHRLLEKSPEKTTIVPDHEPGSLLANIHERDAEETHPDVAHEAADNIRNEVTSTARQHGDEEARNVIESSGKDGTGASDTGGPQAPEGNPTAQAPQAVSGGGTQAPAKGYERVPRKPLGLIDWIKKNGGVKDDGGEVKAIIGGAKGRPGLIRRTGKSLDDVARAAQEAGYLPAGDRPDINAFLEKMRDDHNGNAQFSEHDAEGVEAYNAAIAKNEETDRLVDRFGIDATGKTSAQIYDEIAEHTSKEEQARIAREISESYEKELKEFEAEAAKHTESLEPEEIEPAAGPARTEEELENERQQEIAARRATESAPSTGGPDNAPVATGESQGGVRQGGDAPEPAGRAETPAATGQPAGAKPAGGEPGQGSGNAAADAIRNAQRATESTGPDEDPQSQLGKPKSYYVNDKGVINFDLFKTPEDIQNYLQEWADKNPDKIAEARGGVVTLEQSAKLAESMGMTTKDLLSRKVGELYDGPQQIAAAQLFIQSAKKIKAAADEARASGDPQKVADFLGDLGNHKDFMDMFLQQVGISAEASRALGARRAIRKLTGFDEAMNIGDLFQRMTGEKLEDAKAQADMFASLDSPARVSRQAQKTREADWRDYMIAYRNTNILSGPVTHLHYSDGNMVNLLYKPLKTAVASMLPGGPQLGEAGAMYNSLIMGSVKGWECAKAAWRDGQDKSFQATVENYKRPTDTIYNPVFDKTFGPRGPVAKAIGAMHSLFYTMNLEQEKASLAYRKAFSEGLEEGSPEFSNRVSDLIVSPTEDMVAKADANAKEAMYLKNPDHNSSLGLFTRFSNRTYLGRAFLPFAKLEMNVKLMARDNTVLGLFSKDVRADLAGANGPEARAVRIAGMSMGTSLFGLALASGDLINGSGPSDPNKRKVWLLTHTPNSIQIGNVAVPLRAIGMPGQILMAGAEIKEAIADATDPEATHMAAAFMQHVSSTVFEGTFVEGMKNLTDAAFHPLEYGGQWLQGTADSFVPAATFLGQTNKYIDPFRRDVHSQGLQNLYGVADYVKSRIPFVSQTLEEKVDVLGNPIPNDRWLSAGAYEKYTEDPVVQKLMSIGLGIAPAKRDILGVPLSNKQFNDYAVTSGVLVRQNLEWIVSDPGFDEQPQAAKVKIIHDAVSAARDSAKGDVMLRNPDIMDRAVEKKEKAALQ